MPSAMLKSSLTCRSVRQSRKSFEPAGRNEPGVMYDRGPACKSVHSRRKRNRPRRYPGVRRYLEERYGSFEDDRSFLGHNVSELRHSINLISRTKPLDRYEKGAKLSGVIFIHRISDNRFAGVAKRNFKMFRELCGDTSLKNVVLVTNMWGMVPLDVGESREEELTNKFFKPALDKGAQMARHQNTEQSAHNIVRMIMKNRPVVLQIQRELVDERKDIANTAAGEAVNEELNEQIKKHREEWQEAQDQMVQALKEKDEETRQEMEEETRRLQEQMEEIKKDSEGMASNYIEEKERMKGKLKEIQQEAKKEKERAEAEYQQKMADLKRRLQEVTDKSEEEKARLEQEAEDLERKREESQESGCCIVM